jgi:hypothetical protein
MMEINETGMLRMTLTPTMIEMMKDFLQYIEIEIMQGKKEQLQNGTTYFEVELMGEKARVVKRMMLAYIADESKHDNPLQHGNN